MAVMVELKVVSFCSNCDVLILLGIGSFPQSTTREKLTIKSVLLFAYIQVTTLSTEGGY